MLLLMTSFELEGKVKIFFSEALWVGCATILKVADVSLTPTGKVSIDERKKITAHGTLAVIFNGLDFVFAHLNLFVHFILVK